MPGAPPGARIVSLLGRLKHAGIDLELARNAARSLTAAAPLDQQWKRRVVNTIGLSSSSSTLQSSVETAAEIHTRVGPSTNVPVLPSILADVVRVAAESSGGVFNTRERPPDAFQVCSYEPGGGFPFHVDAASIGPDIGMVSLGEASSSLFLVPREAVMDDGVTLRAGADEHEFDVVPATLVLLSGEARYQWAHGCPPGFTHSNSNLLPRLSIIFWCAWRAGERRIDLSNSNLRDRVRLSSGRPQRAPDVLRILGKKGL